MTKFCLEILLIEAQWCKTPPFRPNCYHEFKLIWSQHYELLDFYSNPVWSHWSLWRRELHVMPQGLPSWILFFFLILPGAQSHQTMGHILRPVMWSSHDPRHELQVQQAIMLSDFTDWISLKHNRENSHLWKTKNYSKSYHPNSAAIISLFLVFFLNSSVLQGEADNLIIVEK